MVASDLIGPALVEVVITSLASGQQLHNDSSSQHRIDQLRKYSSQDDEVVFNQQERRENSFINHTQDCVKRDENGGDQNPKSITSAFGFHPIGKSPSSKVRGHHRTSSGQHGMNQLRSCSRAPSAFPNPQSSTTKPFITANTVRTNKLPSERYHHSYRGYSCKQANPSSDEEPTAVGSFKSNHTQKLFGTVSFQALLLLSPKCSLQQPEFANSPAKSRQTSSKTKQGARKYCRPVPQKSTNKRQPSTLKKGILKDTECAKFATTKTEQATVTSSIGSLESGNPGENQVLPSIQSALVLKDPVPPLTEDHKEQFPGDIRGPQLPRRRDAVCNEIEKKTSRVKINGSRMSLHDMRVDLGELTKRRRICERLLESSELQTEPQPTEEDNIFLREYLNSQKSGRRMAICLEIEKTTSRFKVNGARLSLHHMRAELGGLDEHDIAEETIEEMLNKPHDVAINSNGDQRREKKRRRTTTAIRKFITDFSRM
ncbi:hypothetical protein OS493_029875 [Desmophyllum pertusum]|uniref:Uncharacterized protein n=1 Tax=Desmophyllum pertusum TaxID=174260 RepID=A0A9W9Y937_9CNID|nr:hypothetical protein OS493_029875 [Desmophyllum pertusum]